MIRIARGAISLSALDDSEAPQADFGDERLTLRRVALMPMRLFGRR